MLDRFLSFINEKKIVSSGDKILLAVSGGIDSICMTHLFKESGIKSGIAHCNFRLREEESDMDEDFVRQLAQKYNFPFFVMHFNTADYARLQKISIQMAARELRYNWFENLRKLHGFSMIATAHNADDSIETFFINLLRGTGIQGLTGIKVKNDHLIRPLLFACRNEIEDYCRNQNLEFRIDSSNNSDKYLRNRIRHSLIPLLSEMNPEFLNIMSENLHRLSEAEKIYFSFVDHYKKEILELSSDGFYRINISKIMECVSPDTLLYEILKDFGFSSKTSFEIYNNIEGESGRVYYSEKNRLVKDRNHLILTPPENEEVHKIYIEQYIPEIFKPLHLQIQSYVADGFTIPANADMAALDSDKLVFPLILRKWQHGDYFHPLGMTGMKKVSDFFVDTKLSLTEKENSWLLTSAGEIVWIIGKRIDDRFKITAKTKNIIIISKL